MRGLLRVAVLSFVLVALQSAVAEAAVYSPPWAHLHAYEDQIGSSWKLDWAEDYFDMIGYNAYYDLNLSAYGAYTLWKSDAVFIASDHGVYDSSYTPTETGGALGFGGPRADDPGIPKGLIWGRGDGANSDPNYYISNFASTDVSDCRLAMFIGCYTANEHPEWGSLLDESRAKGVDCVVGWTDKTYRELGAILAMGVARGAYYYPTKPIDNPPHFGSADTDLMQYGWDYMYNNCTNWSVTYRYAMGGWDSKGMYGSRLNPALYGAN